MIILLILNGREIISLFSTVFLARCYLNFKWFGVFFLAMFFSPFRDINLFWTLAQILMASLIRLFESWTNRMGIEFKANKIVPPTFTILLYLQAFSFNVNFLIDAQGFRRIPSCFLVWMKRTLWKKLRWS